MANDFKILNKRARFDYDIKETFEVGIILSGAEVKSVRLKHISLKEAFVKITQNGLSLINATITPYKYADNRDYDPKQSRQLLIKKRELLRIIKKQEGTNLTLIPLSIKPYKRYIKLEIGLAAGKKTYQKREVKKRKDLNREQQQIIKNLK